MLSRVWLRAQSHKPVVWLLRGLRILATYSLPLRSLVLFRNEGCGFAGLQKAAARGAEGFPKAQVLGLGREGLASCYGERNIMRLTCLTGGLEKYPCPAGASEPSIIWKGSFHDEGYLCG